MSTQTTVSTSSHGLPRRGAPPAEPARCLTCSPPCRDVSPRLGHGSGHGSPPAGARARHRHHAPDYPSRDPHRPPAPSGFVAGSSRRSGAADSAAPEDPHVQRTVVEGMIDLVTDTPGFADVVLPLIRTRSDLHRWSAANAHGRQMVEAIAILQDAADAEDPAKVLTVT